MNKTVSRIHILERLQKEITEALKDEKIDRDAQVVEGFIRFAKKRGSKFMFQVSSDIYDAAFQMETLNKPLDPSHYPKDLVSFTYSPEEGWRTELHKAAAVLGDDENQFVRFEEDDQPDFEPDEFFSELDAAIAEMNTKSDPERGRILIKDEMFPDESFVVASVSAYPKGPAWRNNEPFTKAALERAARIIKDSGVDIRLNLGVAQADWEDEVAR